MKLDQNCLVLEKRRCWGYAVRVCIVVLIVMVLTACSTSRSPGENKVIKQPDVPQSQERLEKPAQQVGVSAQTEIGEKAGKRPVVEEASENPVPKQESIEKSEAAIGARHQEDAAQTDDEKLSDMESKMDESLTEFDEMLLERNREISRKKQQMAKDAGEDSTGIGSEDDDMGGQESKGGQDEKRISGSEEGSTQNKTATRPSGPGKGQGAASGQPQEIPDGSDDDVVARQLREAAEKETDPRLKKKLWEEYRRYKEG